MFALANSRVSTRRPDLSLDSNCLFRFRTQTAEGMPPVGTLHDDEYRRFLDRLKAARKAAGLSQTQAGERMGRSQRFVSHCEVGNRRVDALEFRDFCKAYELAPGKLLDGFPATD